MDSGVYIDPRCECDAPKYVDFTELNGQYDDNADEWFDKHNEKCEERFESDFSLELQDVSDTNIRETYAIEDTDPQVKIKEEKMEESGPVHATLVKNSVPVEVKEEEKMEGSCTTSVEGNASPPNPPNPQVEVGEEKMEESGPSEEEDAKLKKTALLVTQGMFDPKLKDIRSFRFAAKKANDNIRNILKPTHKPSSTQKCGGKSEVRVKTTEERQLEEIDRLRKETKKKLRRSQQSFHHLAKIQGPMRAIKGSKPPTETKEFNFSKLASGEKHSCGSTGVRAGEVVHPSNFASTLRSKNVTDSCDSSTGSSKRPPTPDSVTKTKPFKFELDKRRALRSATSTTTSKKEEGPVLMAEFVNKFHSTTPPRFRRSPVIKDSKTECASGSQLTVPKTPNLLTKNRKRPLPYKTVDEIEEEELSKIKRNKFKANPLNPAIINNGGLYGVPRKKSNPTITNPVSPPLATKKLAERRKALHGEEEEEEANSEEEDRKFVAQAMPDFSEIKGVPAKRIRPITEPDTPSVAKRRCMNDITSTSKKDEKEKDESHVIKARPVPNFDKVFVPQYPLRSIEIQPFSFEERDKEKPTRQTLVEKILQKGEKKTVFKAQPLPDSTFQPSVLPKVVQPSTKPDPFVLHTEVRGEQHVQKWKEQTEKQFQDEKRDADFKATDVSVLYTKPFVPERSTRPLTRVENVILHSEQRSNQRAKFEAEKQKRTHLLEMENLQRRTLREAKEAKEIAEYRRSLVHKAMPVGHYAPLLIKPSDKPVTEPISPHFETDRVLKNKYS